MTYDLRHAPWIPWRHRSGLITWAPPVQLVADLEGDPVVAVATSRPDFDGALLELLVGLLCVAMRPADEDEWSRWRDAPPSIDELQARLDALPAAFALDGDGPRFLQDLSAADFADVQPDPVESLLIEAPGAQTRRFNTDLFAKRDRVRLLGRAGAAMALITLQTYAPSGGRGFRTSMRGGGPLTTLVEPRIDNEGGSLGHQRPLWELVWSNVETTELWARRAATGADLLPDSPEDPRWALVFPWLGPTRTSRPDRPTPPQNGHPLQAYFGMPRRVRLEFADAGTCAITGLTDDRTVAGARELPGGVQYSAWRHPLSPYRKDKASGMLPIHGEMGAIGWRDWLGLALRRADGGREPALTVTHFVERRAGRRRLGTARLRAFGYDVANARVVGWVDSALPIMGVADAAVLRQLADVADAYVAGAGIAAAALQGAVDAALHASTAKLPGDRAQVRPELWDALELTFYALVARAAMLAPHVDATTEALAADCRDFRDAVELHATKVFDRCVSSVPAGAPQMRRVVGARFELLRALRGRSPLGRKLFDALRLPPADAGSRKPTSGRPTPRADRRA